MKTLNLSLIICLFLCISCSDDSDEPCCDVNSTDANLIIKLQFDPTQPRLNNLGEPEEVAQGNAAQSPEIARMSANYIEFAPTANTLLGEGEIVFNGEETTTGGEKAINFQEAIFAGDGETFLTVPLNEIKTGSYDWVRVSLAYQEGNIDLIYEGNEIKATLASFVGYNTYIESFDLNGNAFDINANKLQGFWAFEALGFTSQGQAPEGAVTVPNPLFDSSPVPQGSCVVTGEFENGLTITGDETEDIEVTLSFSINNSFEWNEVNADGKYEPTAGETPVDMGLRGLIPYVSKN